MESEEICRMENREKATGKYFSLRTIARSAIIIYRIDARGINCSANCPMPAVPCLKIEKIMIAASKPIKIRNQLSNGRLRE